MAFVPEACEVDCQLKKYSHNLKVESYLIWWKCLGLQAMGTHLSSSEKAAPRRLEGKSGCIQVCNKGSRQSEHQRSGIKLRNSAFSVWEDASLWAHRVHSFHMLLSSLGLILFPCSLCFFVSPAPHQSLWGVAASTGSQFGELSFTFGGQKSMMAVTFPVY